MLTPLAWPEMFSHAECVEIIRMAEAQALHQAGLVRGRRNESIRMARIAWLDDTGDADWILARVMGTVLEANRQHFRFTLTEFAERVQIALYDAEDDGHFDWHIDIGKGTLAAKRKLTLVAQLSNPSAYQGGQLELNATGHIEIVGRTMGDAVLFPSFIPHRVTAMTAGRRYSLTTWIHGPDFQ